MPIWCMSSVASVSFHVSPEDVLNNLRNNNTFSSHLSANDKQIEYIFMYGTKARNMLLIEAREKIAQHHQ